MKLQIETDRETDGRWIAEIPSMPGVMTYGNTKEDAIQKVMSLTLRVIADKYESGEISEKQVEISFA
ncbi:MAG: hypothetical protein A2X61_05475 [Ignavibacteria bacterium GWB2_35_12]|nr:MAG: hypothetical protein A2X63_00010 [Ignavibacteria bacterium GWA2_35_8]OGU40791.1 MAG: hypothetical protein A2X61_05475 [Ignavibacteria bacterium GWB2_35_12]OGU94153.1 MAG: hypothetical protein A2220_11735 [Ignavibacteria bacterium RIFOXYA2_FULL_35_10]OGV23749.1 MAG: hypothetical protein A2475_02180 [Ignavibacteria bacterium RIFOXYC2_FULL_35_21]